MCVRAIETPGARANQSVYLCPPVVFVFLTCDVLEEEASCSTECLFYFVFCGANVKQSHLVLGHLTKQMSAFCLGLYHCVIHTGVRNKMFCLVTKTFDMTHICCFVYLIVFVGEILGIPLWSF